MNRFLQGSRRGFRPGFSLVELLVVVSIMVGLMAVSSPVVSAIILRVRLDGAAARLKGALVQVQTLLPDFATTPNRSDTMPRVPGAFFSGLALVVRWDADKGEYEVFFALNNQAAKDMSGAFMESKSPSQKGYSRIASIEPMTLESDIRVVGLRRNDSKPGKLEIVPDNFMICIDPKGNLTPAFDMGYVNMQTGSSTAAGGWNTAPYAGGDASSASTGEGFPTSLPMVIVYSANAASGLTIDSSLDPNTLIREAKGQVVLCPLQSGDPLDL